MVILSHCCQYLSGLARHKHHRNKHTNFREYTISGNHKRNFKARKAAYLDNFIQVVFSLQYFTSFCPDANEIRIKLLVERFQGLQCKNWAVRKVTKSRQQRKLTRSLASNIVISEIQTFEYFE